MVERFNGRIEDVLQSHHFQSGEELEATLHRYVWLYNQQLPQSALGSRAPLQAMKDWHKLKPELFKKNRTIVRDVTVNVGVVEPDLHRGPNADLIVVVRAVQAAPHALACARITA
jgi:hypothetical protein